MLKRKIRVYASHAIRGRMGKDCLRKQRDLNKKKAVSWGRELWAYFGSQLELYIPGANDDWAEIGMEKGYLTVDQILDIDCNIISQCDAVLVLNWEGTLSGGMKIEVVYANEHGIPVFELNGLDAKNLELLRLFLETL